VINEIVVQDESGRKEAEFPTTNALASLFAESAPNTHCLQFLDHYGDTVFNRAQTVRLIEELQERLADSPLDMQHHIRQLIVFLQPAADEPHLYVKFVGD
jgi:hypothetical protein